ncbi:MAG: hypothetical protein P4L74_03355 [Candidatus Doudnabacteria bacterium]|nr:hypothetical protein [Candidatus Doudnabacteria bacterium]
MGEKIKPNIDRESEEDISLGSYGRFENMPPLAALSNFHVLRYQGWEFLNNHPDKAQVIARVANATDQEIFAWAQLTSKGKAHEDINFYVNLGEGYRTEANKILGDITDIKIKPPTVQ